MKKAEPRQLGQIRPPIPIIREVLPVMITDEHAERIEVMVMFRIISRRSWENPQSWHRSGPGSTVEHLYGGMYVLMIPPGGACEAAA